MRRSVIETIMGGVVLVIAALFLVFAYSSSNLRGVGGYDLIARFNRVDGLADGAEVRLSGIKIGSVVRQDLDPKTYLAVVHLAITDNIKLPIDSTAKIQSDSLLSGSHVNLEPGGDDKMLGNGDEIKYVRPHAVPPGEDRGSQAVGPRPSPLHLHHLDGRRRDQGRHILR